MIHDQVTVKRRVNFIPCEIRTPKHAVTFLNYFCMAKPSPALRDNYLCLHTVRPFVSVFLYFASRFIHPFRYLADAGRLAISRSKNAALASQ